MFQKPLIIFAIVILVLSPTSTYSANDVIKNDISEGQNFYCQDGTSESCCSQLAHRISDAHLSHCASIVLTNNSGYNMTLEVVNLEDGRWLKSEDYGVNNNNISINCEPRPLPDNDSETISSVTSHFLGGIKGYVSFNIHDNITSKFTVSWKVPTVGSPQYEFYFLNIFSNQLYDVTKKSTFGNTVYQITISNKNKPTMPLVLYIILLFVAARFVIILISVIGFSIYRLIERRRINPNPPAFRPGPPAYY
jgi:hypothetical protein